MKAADMKWNLKKIKQNKTRAQRSLKDIKKMRIWHGTVWKKERDGIYSSLRWGV